jgi:Antitoxin VbhA
MTKQTRKNLPRRARQDIVDIAAAISAFEGGEASKFYRSERAKFVRGEIGAEELHERVIKYWNRHTQ